MNRIKTQTKGIKPLDYSGGNSLSIYTFLSDVEYQVQAHFEWNEHQPKMVNDRIDGKHYSIVRRMLERGGRQDIFLGTRDCQGYVEPQAFCDGMGHYDDLDELGFGLMFHGFDYPDEIGKKELNSRFWSPRMEKGVITFCRPEDCKIRKFVREMRPKEFDLGVNCRAVEEEVMGE